MRTARAAALALSLALAPSAVRAQASPGSPGEPPARHRATRVERVERVEAEPVRPSFEPHLPAPLLEPGPRGLLWWQWLAIPVLLALAIGAGVLLGFATRRVLEHLAARTENRWDDEVIQRLARPIAGMWAIGVVVAAQGWLALDPGAEDVLHRVLRAATYLVFFWAGFRLVDVAFSAASQAPWMRVNEVLAGLLPLGRKVGKVVLLALGLVAVLNELGFQVASLLAGLGIGGIAVALAAQKTVENLFGSVAIGVDQPFRVGDFVKVEDVVGTVEAIGMRSTRIRTLDRTIVTIPNGKLSEMRAESYAVRDRIRLYTNLGLSHATTAEQMRAVLDGVEAALRAHPRIWPEGLSVRFTELRESTLNVEIVAWFATADWNEFTVIRQELLLELLRVVERAGTSLAYPTRTVRLVEEKT